MHNEKAGKNPKINIFDKCLVFAYMVTYIRAFIVTSAPVMGIFMPFTNLLPEAICCCLQTCNVYGTFGDIVLHMCTNFHGHFC